jgi:hypothetical protein
MAFQSIIGKKTFIVWSFYTHPKQQVLAGKQCWGGNPEVRVGHQYDCIVQDRLPALPSRLSRDCIAVVQEKRLVII